MARHSPTVDWCGHLVTRRTANVLHAAGINTLAQLAKRSFAELLALPNAGAGVATEARNLVQTDFVVTDNVAALLNVKSRLKKRVQGHVTPRAPALTWTPADIQRGA